MRIMMKDSKNWIVTSFQDCLYFAQGAKGWSGVVGSFQNRGPWIWRMKEAGPWHRAMGLQLRLKPKEGWVNAKWNFFLREGVQLLSVEKERLWWLLSTWFSQSWVSNQGELEVEQNWCEITYILRTFVNLPAWREIQNSRNELGYRERMSTQILNPKFSTPHKHPT